MNILSERSENTINDSKCIYGQIIDILTIATSFLGFHDTIYYITTDNIKCGYINEWMEKNCWIQKKMESILTTTTTTKKTSRENIKPKNNGDWQHTLSPNKKKCLEKRFYHYSVLNFCCSIWC